MHINVYIYIVNYIYRDKCLVVQIILEPIHPVLSIIYSEFGGSSYQITEVQ